MSLEQKANRYIAKPDNVREVVFRNGVTEDIIKVMLYADQFIAEDTKKFTKFFDTGNQYMDFKKIWEFVRHKIRYVKDPDGDEWVQSPSLLWWKTKAGDCKSKSLFVASILKNMGVPYAYRFAAYKDDGVNGIGNLQSEISRLFTVPKTPVDVTHVYVIAYPGTEDEVIIDSVYNRFDSEHPFDYAIDFNPATKTFSRISGIHAVESESNLIATLLKVAAGIAGIYFISQYFENANTN